jgi:hypothetical protein
MRRSAAILIAGLLLAAIPSTVLAADEVFTADLSGGAQVPPIDVDATGEATVTIADDESTVSWEITYSGLTGDPAAGHIHVGPADGTGPVMIPFDSVTATGTSGSFAAADYQTGEGLPADWAGVLEAIRDGNAYVNIHTEANQAGEIRGQLQGSTTPPPTDTVAPAPATSLPGPGLLISLVLVALSAFAIGLRRTARR